MDDITAKLVEDIENKKNEVIVKQLKNLTGIDLDIKSELKRRFKRLVIEYTGCEETVYFNDGSEQGQRIVTFIKKDEPVNFENDKCIITLSYNYY